MDAAAYIVAVLMNIIWSSIPKNLTSKYSISELRLSVIFSMPY